MNWYIKVLKNYAVFSGRARRKEYWNFFLFNLIVALLLGIVEVVLGIASNTDQSVLGNIYGLAVFCPSVAVGVRRMHDSGHHGLWLIVPIANLIFALQDSEPGTNQYGPNPKGMEV